jgi:ABC-type transport system substrate-binding protein
MQSSYWDRTLNRRISRRRALRYGGGMAAAAAFLAACGGDDDDDSGGTTGGSTSGGTTSGGGGGGAQQSGLLTQAEDTFAQAKRGGQLIDFMPSEPRSLDSQNPQADLNNISAEITQTLITEKPGHLEPSRYELTGAFADSWEVTPEQITFHVRDGLKWHNIDPVNGREADADDVIFSLNRHEKLSPLTTLVWQSGGGFAMSPSAPDSRTVVVPLAIPLAYAENWFAAFGSYTGQVMMWPKEAADENVLDLRQKSIGTGPFYLSAHEPSVSFTLTRNPDFYDPDFALVDEIFMPIVPDLNTRIGQLTAGNIYFGRDGNDIIRSENILSMLDENPDLQLYDKGTGASTSVMTFGTQGENPYQDERVRQAISMAFDRDLDIDVRYNVEELTNAGIPVAAYWNSHLGARDSYVAAGWWLDPQTSEFGENGKYFQYNLQEAKKLLSAADYPDGFEVQFSYPHAPQFDRANVVQPYFFYLQELGLTVVDAGLEDYTQGYIPKDRDASGAFEGIGYHSVTGTIPSVVDATSAMVAEHLPSSGVTFHGYSVGGGTGKTGDPALIEILEKARVEKDVETRKSLLYDAQRHLGKAMWNLMEPGSASVYAMAWPAVKSYGVWFSACQNWEKYQLWIDDTLPPFA